MRSETTLSCYLQSATLDHLILFAPTYYLEQPGAVLSHAPPKTTRNCSFSRAALDYLAIIIPTCYLRQPYIVTSHVLPEISTLPCYRRPSKVGERLSYRGEGHQGGFLLQDTLYLKIHSPNMEAIAPRLDDRLRPIESEARRPYEKLAAKRHQSLMIIFELINTFLKKTRINNYNTTEIGSKERIQW